MSIASTILMIRPAAFGFNEETADSNFFQSRPAINIDLVQQQVLLEFDNMVKKLKDVDISVIIMDDTINPPKPDAIFSNDWLSTSPEGIVSVFPMYAGNRRKEKREDIIKWLQENFLVKEVQDWSQYASEGGFLEGRGSMVIDHDNKMIYAAISSRTNIPVLEKFAFTNECQAIVFIATDNNGNPVYHTDMVMSLGENFSVLCEESIEEEWELIAVRQLLESTGHTIIPITRKQMHAFAGNILQVKNQKGENYLLLSQTAFDSLRKEQKQMLEAYAILLPLAVPTIESVAGGSARSMMAEIFLQRKNVNSGNSFSL